MRKSLFVLLLAIGFSSISFAQTNTNGRNFSSTPKMSLVNNQPKVHTPKVVIETSEESSSKQLISETLYVAGRLGIGDDMVDGTAFDHTAMTVMQNNIRLLFDDTSSSGTFPANDWAIRINDTEEGEDNCFVIEDVTNVTVPFKIMAAAGDNAFFINDDGNVGIGTATPSVDVHIVAGDTPAVRLDQDGSGGWGTYVWDIAGNEANFFIRDVTNGNLLPFKIFPGAPTNSLTIEGTGYVGIGTSNPDTHLDVKGNASIDSTLFLTPQTVVSPYDIEGAIYMDGNEHMLKIHNGTEWVTIDNDSQDLVDATLTGTILEIEIENGASVSVDLQPLVQDLEDRIAALETLVSGKESVKYSSARLFQNAPNPFQNQTTITYYIPEDVENAVLKITGVNGSSVKDIVIYERGEGSVIIDGNDTGKGTYFYSLIVDGQKVASKTLVKID